MSKDQWTVMDVLQWSSQDLAKRDIEKPRLDAEVLLGKALGLTRLELYTNFDRPLSDNERRRFRDFISRRRRREPVAYITGEKEFYSLCFEVSPDVLIPRPESEVLVDEVLDFAKGKKNLKVADVCTGSACIAIALAKNLDAEISASDMSAAALDLAAKNCKKHRVSLALRRGNLLEAYGDEETFDVIVSNPPYIEETELSSLPPEVKWEPSLALDGGRDGLDKIRELVKDARAHLNDNGLLLIEIGSKQGKEAKRILERAEMNGVEVLRDLAGLDRVLKGRMKDKG